MMKRNNDYQSLRNIPLLAVKKLKGITAFTFEFSGKQYIFYSIYKLSLLQRISFYFYYLLSNKYTTMYNSSCSNEHDFILKENTSIYFNGKEYTKKTDAVTLIKHYDSLSIKYTTGYVYEKSKYSIPIVYKRAHIPLPDFLKETLLLNLINYVSKI